MDENEVKTIEAEEAEVVETPTEEKTETPAVIIQQDNTELQAAVDGIKTELGDLKTDLSTAMAEIKTSVGSISTAVATLQEDVAGVQSEVAEVRTQVNELNAEEEEDSTPQTEHTFLATPMANGGLKLVTLSDTLATQTEALTSDEESDEEYETIQVNDLEKDNEHHIVRIGRQGENLTQKVVFDCTFWKDILDDPIYSIVAKRHGEKETYLAQNVSAENNIVTWTLSADDTAIAGFGEAEIRGVSGDKVKKSAKFRTWIEASVEDYSGATPVTPPYWGTEILNGVQEAEAAAEEAKTAAEEAATQFAALEALGLYVDEDGYLCQTLKGETT